MVEPPRDPVSVPPNHPPESPSTRGRGGSTPSIAPVPFFDALDREALRRAREHYAHVLGRPVEQLEADRIGEDRWSAAYVRKLDLPVSVRTRIRERVQRFDRDYVCMAVMLVAFQLAAVVLGSLLSALVCCALFGDDLDLPVEKPGPGWRAPLLPSPVTSAAPTAPAPAKPPLKPPVASAPLPEPLKQEDEKPPTIYGTEIRGGSTICYVLDISGSMGLDWDAYLDQGQLKLGDRLDRAKVALVRSIESLPASVKFGVLAYDCSAYVWHEGDLMDATKESKTDAEGWIAKLKPGGATGTGEATALGLKTKAQVVLLLTDGDPNCYLGSANGSCQDPEEHRRLIKVANAQQAIVDVFGICCPSGSGFERFCREVATDNNGVYTSVR